MSEGCCGPGADAWKGGSPAITKGEHAGDTIALDHILPIAVVPELAAMFYNLEVMSAHQNQAKSARIGGCEVEIARRWHREGLLSAAGVQAVEAAMWSRQAANELP